MAVKKSDLEINFQYDNLVERQNICNRHREITQINTMIERKQKIVLYAPRRYGKTSLMLNVSAQFFLKRQKHSIVVYVDFMDVADLESIEKRFADSLVQGFKSHIEPKSLINIIVQYFKNLALAIDIDPISGSPSISLKNYAHSERKSIDGYFKNMAKLGEKYPLLLIFDEFQDIKKIPEAEAILRKNMQQIGKVPILISGSKRTLLSEIFAFSKAPFFGYGDEVTFEPISIQSWVAYFNQRLKKYNKKIDECCLEQICQKLFQVPNAICEVGFWLQHDAATLTLSEAAVWTSINRLIASKSQSFRYYLAPYSVKEKSIMQAIARNNYIAKPNSKEFLREVLSNASSVTKSFQKMLNLGVIEWEIDKGYRLSDPLLSMFLSKQSGF